MNTSDPPEAHPPSPERDPTPLASAQAATPVMEGAAELDALWAHVYKLQTTLAAALVALIILSLGIVLFMGKQMTSLRARLAADRQQSQQIFSDFQQNTGPKVRTFVRSLQAFAATNQDFAPILEKYRPALESYYP